MDVSLVEHGRCTLVRVKMTPPVWERQRHEQDRTRGAAAGVKLMGMHACALPVAEPNVLRKQASTAGNVSIREQAWVEYIYVDR